MSGDTVVQVEVGTTVQRSVTVSRSDDLSVRVAQASPVNSVSASTEVVSVQELGIVGPQGPAGPSGSAPLVFPVTDVSSWYQEHQLGYLPEVRLVDAGNEEVEIGIEYPAPNAVAIAFPVPFTGTIYLS